MPALHACALPLPRAAPLLPRPQDGCTALHYAAWSGRVDIVVELLRAKADAEIKNNSGKTASEEAKEQKQDAVCKMIASGPPEAEAAA